MLLFTFTWLGSFVGGFVLMRSEETWRAGACLVLVAVATTVRIAIDSPFGLG